ELTPFLKDHDIAWSAPLKKLKPADVTALLHGDGRKFPGVLALLEDEYLAATQSLRDEVDPYRTSIPCIECCGARLRPEARAVRLGDQTIQSISDLPVGDVRAFFADLKFDAEQEPIA